MIKFLFRPSKNSETVLTLPFDSLTFFRLHPEYDTPIHTVPKCAWKCLLIMYFYGSGHFHRLMMDMDVVMELKLEDIYFTQAGGHIFWQKLIASLCWDFIRNSARFFMFSGLQVVRGLQSLQQRHVKNCCAPLSSSRSTAKISQICPQGLSDIII